jgi:hypothetical protein
MDLFLLKSKKNAQKLAQLSQKFQTLALHNSRGSNNKFRPYFYLPYQVVFQSHPMSIPTQNPCWCSSILFVEKIL